jgi:hypothetical protein
VSKPSFLTIDYRLRAAKYAERLMMCDAFSRLSAFQNITEYQYVGLGAVYFADFLAFHRILGIEDMVNIEGKIGATKRFIANVPLNITLLFGPTSTEMQKVDITRRTIAWLDYDGNLEANHLSDIARFARYCTSGCVLVVTVREDIGFKGKSGTREAISQAIGNWGFGTINSNHTDDDLVGDGTAEILREAMTNTLTEALDMRNSKIAAIPEQFTFEQILNIKYADEAAMFTLGWVIFKNHERRLFDACEFGNFDFVSKDASIYHIDVPKLTQREIRFLQNQMPLRGRPSATIGTTPASEAAKYERLYRYLPNYASTEWL